MTETAPLLILTGGTRGIGRALLERFALGGFDLAVCARDQAALDRLRADFAEKFPESTLFPFRADVGIRADLDGFVAFVHGLNRPVDVLVNNAGLFRPGQIHNEEEGILEELFAVNLASAYHLTRGLVGGMMARRRGYIVNVCSTASILGYPNGGSYCITKHALLGLSRVLREELKPHGVKVTALLPGATLTASWAGSGLPPERFMEPADVAELVWTCHHLSPGAVVEEILLRPQLGDV
jgi:short-subunit dehydrogenase